MVWVSCVGVVFGCCRYCFEGVFACLGAVFGGGEDGECSEGVWCSCAYGVDVVLVGEPCVVAVDDVEGLVDGEEEFGVVSCSDGLVWGWGVGVAVCFEEVADGGDDFVGDEFVKFFAF